MKAEFKNTHFSSKAFGQHDSKDTALDGKLQLDVLQFMQREQGAQLFFEFCSCRVPWRTERGRTSLSYQRPAEWYTRIQATIGCLLLEGKFESEHGTFTRF